MNKRQTRLFAIISTGVATLVFLGLTIDSHRQFPKLTNAQNITPAVKAGQDVWHKYNCINCHTLFGEGAYYAPDLTKITQLRGEPYLTAYMKDPSQFYDEQKHRRLMPKQNLSDEEIKNLYAFLDWVSKVDNQGWPPRPILVTGASIPGTDMSSGRQAQTTGQTDDITLTPPGARPLSGGENPIALGERLFRSAAPACNACHSIAPGVNMAGPTLAGISARAAQIISSPEYKGKAKDIETYIRESIVEPSAHVVPGPMYSANSTSFMPNTYGKDLKPEHVDQLVAYLASLK
ncbi:MAG: c-type cytochrome [Burkholderiaceae bacterium]